MVRATVRGLVELTRPVNAAVAGVLTFVGAYVAGATAADTVSVAAAILATVLATGGGDAINDYFDRDVDRINDPERPIPRGDVSPRGALAFSGVLMALAVGLALTLPPVAVAIAGINLVALITYTEFFKGTPGGGNALVAYLGGSTFLFGGAVVGSFRAAGVLALLAAVSTFAREIIKDVEDVTGDREEGLETLPVVVGERRATGLAVASLAVALAASPLPFLLGVFGAPYLAVVVPADAVMAYAAYESFDDPGAGHRHLKYGMFLAALSFVVGRVTAGVSL
jgi:geranylgeranylglycerol-phosphate geranylgeranyltransferase